MRNFARNQSKYHSVEIVKVSRKLLVLRIDGVDSARATYHPEWDSAHMGVCPLWLVESDTDLDDVYWLEEHANRALGMAAEVLLERMHPSFKWDRCKGHGFLSVDFHDSLGWTAFGSYELEKDTGLWLTHLSYYPADEELVARLAKYETWEFDEESARKTLIKAYYTVLETLR